MRFYTNQHQFYYGIDLHARSMYVCIVNHAGEILVHRNMKAAPDPFLKAVAPYRDGLVVAVECIFTWYWLADLCAQEGIPFVLGHALYMKAIHGGQAKHATIDAQNIAVRLRGGMLPQAYVYPADMRATRDLLRRRRHHVEVEPEAVDPAPKEFNQERDVLFHGPRRDQSWRTAMMASEICTRSLRYVPPVSIAAFQVTTKSRRSLGDRCGQDDPGLLEPLEALRQDIRSDPRDLLQQVVEPPRSREQGLHNEQSPTIPDLSESIGKRGRRALVNG